MKNVYICPVCGGKLSQTGNTYKCEKSHNFDISKSGYVNLLLSQGKNHGDDAEMVLARTEFLNTGKYAPLCEEVAKTVSEINPQMLLDSGCGEGYYTAYIKKCLPDTVIHGLDISKKAAEKAAKKDKTLNICVASAYKMPYADESFDCVLNVFSPLATEEYRRVTKKGGALVYVVPSPEHLIELKCALYDNVFIKENKEDTLPGYVLTQIKPVEFKMELNNTELLNLFSMTPYFHKTSFADKQKLNNIEKLSVTASFAVYTYIKE